MISKTCWCDRFISTSPAYKNVSESLWPTAPVVAGDRVFLADAQLPNGISTDINTYITHVQTAAAGGTLTSGVVGWQPIAATATSGDCDAWYTSTASPVYLVNAVPANMEKVADNLADMSKGSILTAIDTLENGTVETDPGVNSDTVAFTGCSDDMKKDPGLTLGSSSVRVGMVTSATSSWIAAGSAVQSEILRMYAASPLLTVPGAVGGSATGVAW